MKQLKKLSAILDTPLESSSVRVVESFINSLHRVESGKIADEIEVVQWGRFYEQLHYIIALARIAELGIGVEKDFEYAFELFELAATYDDSYALMILAQFYLQGIVVEKNIKKSTEYLWLSVLHGCNEARVLLAGVLETHKADSSSLEDAFWLYLTTAREGDFFSQWKLGNFYLDGVVVSKNRRKALKWIFSAAKGGVLEAKYQLASDFVNGELKQLDPKLAYKWLLESAEAGVHCAYSHLAELSFYGIGCERDLQKSEYYFIQAAENGGLDEYTALGSFYLCSDNKQPNYSKAYKALILPADEGHKEAMLLISEMYKQGLGVIASDRLAELWRAGCR